MGGTLPNNQMAQYDCDVTSDMIGLDDTNGTYRNSGCTFCHSGMILQSTTYLLLCSCDEKSISKMFSVC